MYKNECLVKGQKIAVGIWKLLQASPALKDKFYRDCVSYWIKLIMDDVKNEICCNLTKNMRDFSKISA